MFRIFGHLPYFFLIFFFFFFLHGKCSLWQYSLSSREYLQDIFWCKNNINDLLNALFIWIHWYCFPLLFFHHTIVAGYYGIRLVVRVSIRLPVCMSTCSSVCPSVHQSVVHPSICPYFHFLAITWVNVNGALILWRSGFGSLLNEQFCQFLTANVHILV